MKWRGGDGGTSSQGRLEGINGNLGSLRLTGLRLDLTKWHLESNGGAFPKIFNPHEC